MKLRASSLELIGHTEHMENEIKHPKRKHDAFFRWLFANTTHVRYLLELAAKVNHDIDTFLTQINLDTLMRIPDSYSEVDDTGEADLAFRVNVSTGAPILVGILLEHKSGRDPVIFDQISKYIHSVMKITGQESHIQRDTDNGDNILQRTRSLESSQDSGKVLP